MGRSPRQMGTPKGQHTPLDWEVLAQISFNLRKAVYILDFKEG